MTKMLLGNRKNIFFLDFMLYAWAYVHLWTLRSRRCEEKKTLILEQLS